jgi:hypothetical protein
MAHSDYDKWKYFAFVIEHKQGHGWFEQDKIQTSMQMAGQISRQFNNHGKIFFQEVLCDRE